MRISFYIAGGLCLISFAWALLERERARRLVQHLTARSSELYTGGFEHAGAQGSPRTRRSCSTRRACLMVLSIAWFSAPNARRSALVPNLITLLLGWWQIPFGPIYTVGTLLSNARAEHTTSARQLLDLCGVLAEEGALQRYKYGFFVRRIRSLLALDSGSKVKIAVNLLAALFVSSVLGLVVFAMILLRLRGR